MESSDLDPMPHGNCAADTDLVRRVALAAGYDLSHPFNRERAEPRMTHDRPVMPGWYGYALPDTWTIQPAWVYRYEGELWYTLDAIPDRGPDDGFEMAQCSEDAIWSAEPMQSFMLHSSQEEIRALREFHDFFSNQTERLFAEFGMPAVDLYNAVRSAQRAKSDKDLLAKFESHFRP